MSERTIHKAIIPVAGLGTRMRPLSAVVPKAMMPLPDRQGRVLPVLHHVLAEAKAAGVSEAAVTVSPNPEAMIEAYLRAAADAGATDLPETVTLIGRKGDRVTCKSLLRGTGFDPSKARKLRFRDRFVPANAPRSVQDKPLGFGHSVWLGKSVIGCSPFLVFLGDHVQIAEPGRPACAAQVARAFARMGGAAMIGMQPVPAEELPRVGVAGGTPVAKGKGIYRCTAFTEKPDLAAARARLRTPGLKKDHFLAHCGIYAFAPEIFDCLEELMAQPPARGSEYQLADAQSMLLRRHPADYYLVRIEGRAYDTGTPEGYVATWRAAVHLLGKGLFVVENRSKGHKT